VEAGRLSEAAGSYEAVAESLGKVTPAAVHSNHGAVLLALDRTAEAEV